MGGKQIGFIDFEQSTVRTRIKREKFLSGMENVVPCKALIDLREPAKAHIRAKVEQPFRLIKRQFGFQKNRLRGIIKSSLKDNVLAALANLFIVPHEPLCRPCSREWFAHWGQDQLSWTV